MRVKIKKWLKPIYWKEEIIIKNRLPFFCNEPFVLVVIVITAINGIEI